MRTRRKTAAEADCGLPSGGADYAGTIGLTHDATVAGRIDRGAANAQRAHEGLRHILHGRRVLQWLCLQPLFTY